MQPTTLLRMLIGMGLLACLCVWGGAGAPAAQAQPPRPTLTPTRSSGGGGRSAPQPTGRITGTVIDLTSGAPAPGVVVVVGDARVTTDANGNYDRSGLAAGSYAVELALAAGQGEPAQGAIMVALAAGATVVQHLAFRSPPLAVPTPTPVVPAALPATGAPSEAGWLTLALALAAITLGILLRLRQLLVR